jgi:hypothetical protein
MASSTRWPCRRRLQDAEPVEQGRERSAPRLVDGLHVEPSSGTPPPASAAARLSGRLAAERDERRAARLGAGLGTHDGQHALRVERLEVERVDASKSVETSPGSS